MATEFHVSRTFVLEDRGLFAVEGVIREGMVQMGMTAVLVGQEAAFTRRVHSVEVLGEEGHPVLLFSFSRPEKAEAWRALDWDDETLTLTW